MKQAKPEAATKRDTWLVMGMGSMAFGKERRAATAFRHMTRIRPHFLTSRWENGNVDELLRENGFEYTRTYFGYLGRQHLSWTLINFSRMPVLFWTVLRKYRELRCRGILVLVLGSFLNALPPVVLLRLFSRARIVFYLGDIPANTWPNRLVCRVANSLADAFVANSQAVRRGLERLGIPENRVNVVYNGKELERFQQAVPLPFREQFGWNHDALLIGYIGQFAINKGIWDFIHAAERVLTMNDECRFVLIGQADETNVFYRELVTYLRVKNLADRIVFVGWVQRIEQAYAALNVVVVPSRIEDAAPNVILEAAASGVPAIATPVGGSPELVAENETGFLVGVQQPEEIAQRIIQLAGDPDLRRLMGQAGRARAARLFDCTKNSGKVEKFLIHD